ncbi:hypothetical protein GCG54_00011901 [Colletotrichum gloeosporioides]|uniref:DUF6604 domain-containing protein n=1 Tax=Colletotrichum gloeosporioides TaxID=474922 RepID=A0A8H4FE95_COLGL|nr:uncharacterized protein GCG54_00011901 [Colletotrichum gloeosporioides]KAF3797809.1 hypothetical protein GCG54_00011901 [Colletotrichum gloeosporioides]
MPSGQQYAPAKMMDLIKDGLSHFGVDLRAGSSHKNRIEAAGFQNLIHDVKKLPVGTRPKDSHLKSVGSYARAVIYDGLHGNTIGLFTRGLGWTPLEVEAFLVECRREMLKDDVHPYILYHSYSGRKPLRPAAAVPIVTCSIPSTNGSSSERPTTKSVLLFHRSSLLKDFSIFLEDNLFRAALSPPILPRNIFRAAKILAIKAAHVQWPTLSFHLPILTTIEDDHIMELICLFNDARDVRNFLKRSWTRYAERKTDLVTASLISNSTSRGFIALVSSTLCLEYTFCALGEAKHWLVMPTETEAKAFAYDNMQRIIRSGWIPTPEIDDWLMSDMPGKMSTAAMCRTFFDLYTISGLHSFVESDLKQFMSHHSIQHLIEIDKSSGIQDSLMKAHLDALFPPINSDQKKLSVRAPLFLGSVLGSLVLKLNSSELSLVNKSGSLMAAAHLYNALRVFNPQTMPRWHDLDLLIELQKEPMFAPEPPTEFAQCVSRFWIAQGLKPSEIVSARMTSRRLALASGRKHPTELYEKRLAGLKRGSGRRELRLAPLLQHLPWMRCITGGWKLSMDEKTVRGAVETDLGKRLGRVQSPPRASDLLVVVWLGQLEKMIQAETPSLFFGFTELGQIVLDSLGSLASTGAAARAFEQPDSALASWKKNLPSDRSLLESEHKRWLGWCR